MSKKCITEKICEHYPHIRTQIDEILILLTQDEELKIHSSLAKELLKDIVDRSEECGCRTKPGQYH